MHYSSYIVHCSKIAFRTLRKQKLTTTINVGGLALGAACCLLLFLFVRHEWTYDRFHTDADRLYRMVSTETQPDGLERAGGTPTPLAEAMEQDLPGVEDAVRIDWGNLTVRRKGREFEEGVLFADPRFFEVFSFPLTKGDPKTALDDPNGAVLTKELARTYFGEQNPVGKTLTVAFGSGARDYRVAGVAENAPPNSSIPLGIVLPFEEYWHTYTDRFASLIKGKWEAAVSHTYVRLNDAAQAEPLRTKLPAFVDQHYGEDAARKGLQLQPLTEVHLTPGVTGGMTSTSDPVYSYILAGIALLVLLMACINFTTLALGRSASRALEVGVRKTMGARREQVAGQFWAEAVLTSLGALLIGTLAARALLPVFERLTETSLRFSLGDPSLWGALAVLALVTGLVAGGYPALVLSGFHPARALKGDTRLGGRGRLTQALVVVQFGVAVALVAGAFVMAEQMRYVSAKNLGFDEDQVVLMRASKRGTSEGAKRFDAFRQQVLRQASVRGVTGSLFAPMKQAGFDVLVQADDTTQVRTQVNVVDSSFARTMRIPVKSGRDFGRSSDESAVLVNEAFVDAMGWREPVGKTLPVAQGAGMGQVLQNKTVVGVTENFHFQPLRKQIAPLVIASREAVGAGVGSIAVRLAGGDVQAGLDRLRETWSRVAPEASFEYEFLDDVVRQQYAAERRWQALVRYAAGFALLIACFGLFGLATYTTERRTKEVGIRKALGASAAGVVGLLSKDFLKLIALAVVLAVPAAWYAAHAWLEHFAYRVDLGPLPFLLAGALVLVVAFSAIGYRALRAAWANPADALRYE